MTAHEVINQLYASAGEQSQELLQRFAIKTDSMLGISLPTLRKLAKTLPKKQALAQELWNTKIREARILASMVAQAECMSAQDINTWVNDFDSWEICDQTCTNVLIDSPFSLELLPTWSTSPHEFVKRTAYSFIAVYAVHTDSITQQDLELFFALIKNGASDERNFVKKAVNWALRQIGKRNIIYNRQAISVAQELEVFESKSTQWIAKDALKELTSQAVQERLVKKNNSLNSSRKK